MKVFSIKKCSLYVLITAVLLCLFTLSIGQIHSESPIKFIKVHEHWHLFPYLATSLEFYFVLFHIFFL